MATWDSADLLARMLRAAKRPTTDADLTSTVAYSYLAAAQAEIIELIATQCPWVMMGAPTLMVTADSGLTYSLSGGAKWVGKIEVYPDNRPYAQPLKEGALWDASVDYSREGQSKIRMAGNKARTFSGGPYIRYVAEGGALDAGNAPTLVPDRAREAVVYLATAKWAREGGLRNPAPYLEEYSAILFGDDTRKGIIVSLMDQEGAGVGNRGVWYRSPDLGRVG